MAMVSKLATYVAAFVAVMFFGSLIASCVDQRDMTRQQSLDIMKLERAVRR